MAQMFVSSHLSAKNRCNIIKHFNDLIENFLKESKSNANTTINEDILNAKYYTKIHSIQSAILAIVVEMSKKEGYELELTIYSSIKQVCMCALAIPDMNLTSIATSILVQLSFLFSKLNENIISDLYLLVQRMSKSKQVHDIQNSLILISAIAKNKKCDCEKVRHLLMKHIEECPSECKTLLMLTSTIYVCYCEQREGIIQTVIKEMAVLNRLDKLVI